MNYTEFRAQQTQPWQVTDGGGQTKFNPADISVTPSTRPMAPMAVEFRPSGPYEDPYIFRELGALKSLPQNIILHLMPRYLSQFDFSGAQAFEFEFHLVFGGKVYNGGIQANFAESGMWQVYNFKPPAKWMPTKLPVPTAVAWASGVDISAVYTLKFEDVQFEGLMIDGTWNPIGIVTEAVPTTDFDKFNIAYQLDGGAMASPQSMLIGDYRVQILG